MLGRQTRQGPFEPGVLPGEVLFSAGNVEVDEGPAAAGLDLGREDPGPGINRLKVALAGRRRSPGGGGGGNVSPLDQEQSIGLDRQRLKLGV